MKINQVAELVDITKKNIRFYEDQGLVDPGRDPQNGYRKYSLDDVRQLERIKLFRQLGISCENIRKMKDGKLEIEKCMHDRLRELEEEEHSIDHMRTMCDLLSQETGDLSSVDASLYLEKMKELEKGGGKFMNVRTSDVRKRKTGAILAGLFMILMMAALIVLIFWADKIDPAPKFVLIFMVGIFGVITIGVLIALIQRLKEVKKGELDEANKY